MQIDEENSAAIREMVAKAALGVSSLQQYGVTNGSYIVDAASGLKTYADTDQLRDRRVADMKDRGSSARQDIFNSYRDVSEAAEA